jgi:nucleoside-diphosphate-sugar epimerase
MNILLTGATGYIGSNLLNELVLNEQNNIICTYRNNYPELKFNNLKWIKYDGNISSLFKITCKIDIIIHLATFFSSKNDYNIIDEMISSNITFGVHILEFAIKNNIKFFVNTSSYAQSVDNMNYNPQNFYTSTKQAFEDILKFYTASKMVKCINISLSDVYGINDNRPKFINLLINSIINKEEKFNMSPGHQNIRYLYVDDAVRAFISAIDLLFSNKINESETYSVYGAEDLTLLELVNIALEISGVNMIANAGYYPYRPREIIYNKPRFEKLPNWSPNININEGIIKLLNENK